MKGLKPLRAVLKTRFVPTKVIRKKSLWRSRGPATAVSIKLLSVCEAQSDSLLLSAEDVRRMHGPHISIFLGLIARGCDRNKTPTVSSE